jgi:uncharacterized membrane protein
MAVMKRVLHLTEPQAGLFWALLLSSTASATLFLIRVASGGTWRYLFMLWNLILAWLPLAFAWWLVRRLKKGRWWSWQGLLLTALWLGFLPNSFYIVSDFIHLRATGEVGLLYDVVVLSAFVFNGLVLGFISICLVHLELLKRIRARYAHSLIVLVLLLCSFAIYLGRYLRWNTWDILVNPAGILFDVSDRFINPAAYPRTFSTTASFFVLLGMMYLVGWHAVKALIAEAGPIQTVTEKPKQPHVKRIRRKSGTV